MIISRWRGFEIDSSEGYYYFSPEVGSLDRAFEFLEAILRSRLISPEVSFYIEPFSERRMEVYELLDGKFEKLKKPVIHQVPGHEAAGPARVLLSSRRPERLRIKRFRKKMES